MIIDESKEREELIKNLHLPVEHLVIIPPKEEDWEYYLIKIYGKNPPNGEETKDEPYAMITADYNAEYECFDYNWESVNIKWQKLVKDYEGELQEAICKGHELFGMYDIILRHYKAFKLVITDLKGKNLGLCVYEFVDSVWYCRIDYGSQSNHMKTRPISNQTKSENHQRPGNAYVSHSDSPPPSEKEIMLSAVTQEHQMKLDHQKVMKTKELQHSNMLHKRNVYYKGGLSVLFVAALVISFFTDNVGATAPMVAVLLGSIFAPTR